MTSLAVAPTAHLPRGMIARIALRLLGGPAAQHTNYVMCGFHECTQIANLAVCQYCSSCVCSRHRILSGNVGYDAKHKDKALGGLNCQCFAAEVCAVNQKRAMQYLGIPEHIVCFQPKVKGTGKGKDKAGKGKSKRCSSSSSSGWRPEKVSLLGARCLFTVQPPDSLALLPLMKVAHAFASWGRVVAAAVTHACVLMSRTYSDRGPLPSCRHKSRSCQPTHTYVL